MRPSAAEIFTGTFLCVLLTLSSTGAGVATPQEPETSREDDAYLSWSREEALAIGESMRAEGRAGNLIDTRIRNTERSYKYVLRVTWLTPEVIRAKARLIQLEEFLTDRETEALVEEAEAVEGTVMLVEIDPREGSGVIPLDWLALLRPLGVDDPSRIVRGRSEPRLRHVRALQGVLERDYAFDIFWIVCPLVTEAGDPLLPDEVHQAEMIVRIHEKEERVAWTIPSSIRDRMREAASGSGGRADPRRRGAKALESSVPF